MTQEDKNIAICVARGLGPFERFNNRGEQSKTGKQLRYKQDEGGGAYSWQPLPNHFKCLNACREFEVKLSDKNYAVFSNHLEQQFQYGKTVRAKSANAEQRAESFGKTMNLW